MIYGKLWFTLALMASLCLTAKAQSLPNSLSSAQPGEYLLVDGSAKQHAKKIKIFPHQLVAKNDQGKTTKWTPEQVRYVHMGSQRYVTATGFTVKNGFGTKVIDERVFVELLDSGQVCLMSYQYAPGNGLALTSYLIQYGDQAEATTIPYSAYTGSGKRFREAVEPYVAARPDLRKLLMAGSISVSNFPEFIHALNTGLPYTGSLLTPSSSDED
jgi:hypothetical protein